MADTIQSIGELLLHRITVTPAGPAYSYPTPAGWKSVNWAEFGAQARKLSMGLRTLGLSGGDKVAILSTTRYEWILGDFAVLAAGGVTTTIYPSSQPEECAYIINDSGTSLVLAENDEQVAKLLGVRPDLKNVKKVITFEGSSTPDGWVVTLQDVLAMGEGDNASAWADIIHTTKRTDIATIMYTSGTTGRPKGVVLLHDNWLYEGEALAEIGLLSPSDVQYLWLPLAHSFGKVLQMIQLRLGFHTAVDGRPEKLIENMPHVRPTFVASVPRVFEKVHNKIVEKAQEGGATKYKIFRWAIATGREASKCKLEGKPLGLLLSAKLAVAERLVFKAIKDKFGGRLKWFVSGSAPLSMEMASFFSGIGITILEGYGLTETSAASFVSRPESNKLGTVGPPIPGTQLRFGDDGEILIKGRGVMREYYRLPEDTAAALDKDGWLHSGDIGEVDSNGRLRITDRKKDLIKTSGGKYVSPQYIEGKFKAICPYVAQPIVHGNNRPAILMLIALDPEAIMAWASKNGIAGSFAQVASNERTRAMIAPYVDELNRGLANFESVKNFIILDRDLTSEDGDLTPSLKLKRRAVETKFQSAIDDFYKYDVAKL